MDPQDPKFPKPPGSAPRPPMPSSSKYDDEDEEEKSGSHAANIMAIVMLVAIAVLGGLLFVSFQRGKAEDKVKKEAAARAASEEARADSIAKHLQDSLFAARQDSLAKFAPKKPATTHAGGATAGATGGTSEAPPPPPTKFGIDVGTFLNQDRANSEQGKLQGSTGLTAKVTPVTEDGVTAYRVVLGEFTSRADAEKKANELILGQAVREAKVIKLKAGS